jgi:hypothetical protein
LVVVQLRQECKQAQRVAIALDFNPKEAAAAVPALFTPDRQHSKNCAVLMSPSPIRTGLYNPVGQSWHFSKYSDHHSGQILSHIG